MSAKCAKNPMPSHGFFLLSNTTSFSKRLRGPNVDKTKCYVRKDASGSVQKLKSPSAKMQSSILILIGALLLSSLPTDGARILVIFPIPAKSHISAYQPLVEELAIRGHEMTVVTPFPRKKPLKNYNEIIYEDTFPARDSSEMNIFENKPTNIIFMTYIIYTMFSESCKKALSQTSIQNLIHSTDKEFDLIIYEPFVAECFHGILHKYKVPSVHIFPNTLIPFFIDVVGNPSTISYVPDIMAQTEEMNFMDRLYSLVRTVYIKLFRHLIMRPKMDAIMRQYFSDPTIPSLSELEKNTSLLLLRSHPAVNFPRPFTPNTIDVSGLHIRTSNSIPKDLKDFLDNAPHGVIYFSLGSNVRSVDMPIEMRNAILKSFSKLKQKIIWKWESDTLPGQPDNVRLGKWLPQHDILAHPNVKLFITHGGLMSLEEATYFGVPLVAIPVMGDQKNNAMHAKNSGYAVVLEVQNITERSLDWAIQEVLHEPRYRERAQELSKIFQDQPQTPLDRAVYWIEHVIRHNGAVHMRSAATNLNFFQYYLVDVLSFILIVTLISLFVLLKIMKFFLKSILGKSSKTKTDIKKKKRN